MDTKDKTGVVEFKDSLEIGDGTNGHLVPHKRILERLSLEKNKENWCKLAILYILGTLLTPGSSPKISVAYHKYLKNMDEVLDYDWCAHVLAHIKEAFSKRGVKCPKADFHFLLVCVKY